MASTLLELVQQASAEMGLAVPNTVAGNTAADTTQMFYLINALGNEVAREYPWEALNTEYRWFSQYAESQGAIANGSAVITGVDPAVVAFINAQGATNFQIQGEGILQDTYVTSALGTTVTCNRVSTGAGSGNYVFGQTK